MSRAHDRRALIAAIEAERGSRVITYFVSDRPGLQGQIGEDAVRTVADHLRALGECRRIDLVLHSAGGAIDVPWKLVSLLRRHVPRLEVLVAAKASSAATLVCLGADAIVLGRAGELGPIDPQISFERGRGEDAVEEVFGLEDLTAYLRFVRKRVGVSDPTAVLTPLAEELPVALLGRAERSRRAVRVVARRLLRSRGQPPDPAAERRIVATLAGGSLQHSHGIGLDEARAIGLPAVAAPPGLEAALWKLHESYEAVCHQRTPFDPRGFLGDGDERNGRVVLACIESAPLAHHQLAEVRVVRRRRLPEQMNIVVNVGAGALAEAGSDEVAARVRRFVTEEIERRLPTLAVEVDVAQLGWTAVEWPS